MKLNRIPQPILTSTLVVIALVALWHFGSKWYLSHGSSAPPAESTQGEIPKRITSKRWHTDGTDPCRRVSDGKR